MTGDLFSSLKRGRCRSCGAEVIWITTAAKRKPMPLDPDVVTVVDDAGHMHRGRESHFATCPHAEKHRRRQ